MGDQGERPIREELLSIPGIAGAEFEGDPETPSGVRVQLAPGADPERVGRDVRRVLAGHGMRSQMTAAAVAAKRAPAPPEPRAVVKLADYESGAASEVDTPEPEEETTAAETIPGDVAAPAATPVEPGVSDEAAAEAAEPPAEVEEVPARGAVPLLGDVVVSQRGRTVTVSVAVGDRVAERAAVATTEGIDRALLEAVCELLDVAPVPALVSVGELERSGSSIVLVVVDDGSGRRAGSCVGDGSRAWAVARAFWSAVSGPA